MRARSLFATLFSFGCLGALVACSGNAGSGGHVTCDHIVDCAAGSVWDEAQCECVAEQNDGGPCVDNADCAQGTHWDRTACACVADKCADPGICGQGMRWDYVACSCQPNVCTGDCAVGYHLDPNGCTCEPDADGGPNACFIPGYGECAYGTTCVTGYCPDGQPTTCECFPNGVACSSCVGPFDGGPPPIDGGPYDAPPPPPPDSAPTQGCYLPGYGYCPPFTTCNVGYCPDGITPISCFCQGDGNAYCTGACPPYADAGGH